MELSDLLLESCNIMREYSEHCLNDFFVRSNSGVSRPVSCHWYHSVWQYLRVLDCVSSPQWHEDFFSTSIEAAIEDIDCPTILISGTADYSLLYLVSKVLRKSNKAALVDVVDMCSTPLNICEWFMDRMKKTDSHYFDNINIRPFQQNIALFDIGTKYDVICTDAFLTRFSSYESQSIIDKWCALLKVNSRIVTTVRVHDASENACPSFAEMVSLIQSYLTKVQRRYKNLSSEQKNLFHISINELNYLAARYIEKMESSNLGTQEDIISLFRRSNLIIDSEKSSIAGVEGEILPTHYYRIVAIKDK